MQGYTTPLESRMKKKAPDLKMNIIWDLKDKFTFSVVHT